ncbi:MAG: DUF1552 domain-containing protein [Polyangiaceae bacterium]|jgi:hypothetical protein|nr:DUF1552 domain-containing protein [Polyangiaceae bacterium]
MVRLGRRKLMAGLGAATLAGPLVSSLSRRARAAAGKAKNLVIFYVPIGMEPALWEPEGTETAFTIKPGTMLEPLADMASELTLCGGLYVGSHVHEEAWKLLTAAGTAASVSGGASVDVFVGNKLYEAGQGGSKPYLILGPWKTSQDDHEKKKRISFVGADQASEKVDDPAETYKLLFGSFAGGDAGVEKLVRRKQSVLDVARADLADLRAAAGLEEQRKLDAHLEALRSLEKGLGGTLGCAAKPAPPPATNPEDAGTIDQNGRAQLDLLAMALACGVTRVATVQWFWTDFTNAFTWLGLNEDTHNTLSHYGAGENDKIAKYIKCQQWLVSEFRHLVDTLKKMPSLDGPGSVYDETLIVLASEGQGGNNHKADGGPVVFAGGAGGYLKPGRFLKYNQEPVEKLLVSICQGMGLPNESFGDTSRGSGPLAGLSS